MAIRQTVLGGALLFGTCSVHALDGEQLYAYCTKPMNFACGGYVEAIVDVLQGGYTDDAVYDPLGVSEPGNIVNKLSACFPGDVRKGQAVGIVYRYLSNHPELRRYGAASLVAAALHEAFPCPKIR